VLPCKNLFKLSDAFAYFTYLLGLHNLWTSGHYDGSPVLRLDVEKDPHKLQVPILEYPETNLMD